MEGSHPCWLKTWRGITNVLGASVGLARGRRRGDPHFKLCFPDGDPGFELLDAGIGLLHHLMVLLALEIQLCTQSGDDRGCVYKVLIAFSYMYERFSRSQDGFYERESETIHRAEGNEPACLVMNIRPQGHELHSFDIWTTLAVNHVCHHHRPTDWYTFFDEVLDDILEVVLLRLECLGTDTPTIAVASESHTVLVGSGKVEGMLGAQRVENVDGLEEADMSRRRACAVYLELGVEACKLRDRSRVSEQSDDEQEKQRYRPARPRPEVPP